MVSILIVNWNGERYIYDCLESIRSKVTVAHEVIVVDNNSTDGSPERIAEKFPWVKLVRSEDNLGFAGGNNLAARHAAGKYLLLLNNDTVLKTDLADAIAVLDADERVGVVGASMFGADGEPGVSCAHFPTPARLWFFSSMYYATREPRHAIGDVRVHYCDFVEGSFLMTRTSCWQRLGGIDEKNYMYGDDVEYCRSLLNMGFITVQCPSVQYTHFGGYSHERMGYLFGGFRKYHRKFSSRRVQLEADFVLRVGLLLRLPWYWAKATLKNDKQSREALKYALQLNRNWSSTLVDAQRYHS